MDCCGHFGQGSSGGLPIAGNLAAPKPLSKPEAAGAGLGKWSLVAG